MDSSERPGDVLLPNWSHGWPVAVDISPLQQQTIADAASTPGHTLQVGVCCKLTFHLSSCCSVGVEFIPLVAETLGDLAEDAITTIRAIGYAVGQRIIPPHPPSTFSGVSPLLLGSYGNGS